MVIKAIIFTDTGTARIGDCWALCPDSPSSRVPSCFYFESYAVFTYCAWSFLSSRVSTSLSPGHQQNGWVDASSLGTWRTCLTNGQQILQGLGGIRLGSAHELLEPIRDVQSFSKDFQVTVDE